MQVLMICLQLIQAWQVVMTAVIHKQYASLET